MPETVKQAKLTGATMTGQQHVKRFEALKALRIPIEQDWQDACEVTYPLRGEQFNGGSNLAVSIRTSAADKQRRVYDSTAKDAVRKLASMVQSGVFPFFVQWLGLEIPNVTKENDKEAIEWLQDAATTVWKNIHASNFDVTVYDGLIDFNIVGMFALFIEPGKEGSGKPYNFKMWPLHSIYCADSTGQGFIDTVYRSFRYTAEQAVSEYGAENLPEKVVKASEKEPDKTFDFIHAIYPRKNAKDTPLELPIASTHIEVQSKRIVRESGFEEMPVAVPRYSIIPESQYSTGPIDDTLADIQTLNELVKLTLAAADFAVKGFWGAVNDGVLNPRKLEMKSGTVIAMAAPGNLFPLTTGADFNVGELKIDNLQRSIKTMLLGDQLHPQEGPAMTAFEVSVRREQIRQIQGPAFGRFQGEFFPIVVERCTGIAIRANALGTPPESIADKLVNVKSTSPFTKAQEQEEVGAIERFEAGLFNQATAGRPESLDILDIDESNRAKGRLLGVDEELIRDEEGTKAVREARKAAQDDAVDDERGHEIDKAVAPKAVSQGGSAAA